MKKAPERIWVVGLYTASAATGDRFFAGSEVRTTRRDADATADAWRAIKPENVTTRFEADILGPYVLEAAKRPAA